MKLSLALCALLAAVCSAVPLSHSEEAVRLEWSHFKTAHGKSYQSELEEAWRFKIFAENRKKIAEHNERFAQGLESHELGMNPFGDMHHREFVATMNGYKAGKSRQPAPLHQVSVEDELPDSIDWREKGYVTPIKNQGQCGSCWSFSATGSLEGQLFHKTGKLVSLSEQNLVDCSSGEPYHNQGCNGGWMDAAFTYIKDNKGIDTEESYPYTEKDGKCHYSEANKGGSDVGFKDIKTGSEDDLKHAVATVGPVAVAIDASPFTFQFYKSGVYHSFFCSSTELDHGVLVVGYGTEDSKDYWIVKNSWGTKWGMDGYFKLSRNRRNHCGVATKASYPLV